MVFQGVKGVKTFKPIIKEISHPEIYNSHALSIEDPHSKRVKVFRKKVVKIIIVTITLSLLCAYVGRTLFIQIAD